MRKKYLFIIWVIASTLLLSGAEDKKQTEAEEYNTPRAYYPFKNFKNPYKKFYTDPLKYTGYGRNKPEPKQISSVKIGFLGPIKPTVSVATGGSGYEIVLGKRMLRGAQLAIETANQQGGYTKRQIPYEMIVKNDNGLWGASGNEIIDFAYKDKVWGILGTIDGANSHIAIRVALKAEVVMVNSGDTDPTFSETGIPWAFRNIVSDRQMCYFLADYIFKKLKLKRIAALRSNNRYGRIGIDEFRDAARRLGHPFVIELNYNNGDTDFRDKLSKIKALKPDAVITYGDLDESAMILKQMRELNMEQCFLGSDRMVSERFFKKAGNRIGKVIAGYPFHPGQSGTAYTDFQKRYRDRFGESAEAYAAHAYDAMMMLIEAIEKGGLNRYRIRDALANMKTYRGVSGLKQFDNFYNNVSMPSIAVAESGRWRYLTYRDVFR